MNADGVRDYFSDACKLSDEEYLHQIIYFLNDISPYYTLENNEFKLSETARKIDLVGFAKDIECEYPDCNTDDEQAELFQEIIVNKVLDEVEITHISL